MTSPIEIAVVREAKTWWVRYGSVELDYKTHAEAIADAIAIAHAFGREGRFSSVRMDVMTSVYGPEGFIRAVPSAKLARPSTLVKPKEVAVEGGSKNTLTE